MKRIAFVLIGINGTGKPGLLNIIAGVDSGDGDLVQFGRQVIIKLGLFPRIKHLTRILRLQKPCSGRHPDHKSGQKV